MSKNEIQKIVDETEDGEPLLLIDAVMCLTSSNSRRIKTIAFATLSQLSLFAAKDKHVLAQVRRDTKI